MMTFDRLCRIRPALLRWAAASLMVGVSAWSASTAIAEQTFYPVKDGTLLDNNADGLADDADWTFNQSSYEGSITLTTDATARNVNLEHRLAWEYDLSTVTLEPPVVAVLNFTIRGAPIWPFPDMTVNIYSYPADLLETLADFSSGPAVLQGSANVVGYQLPTPYSLNVSDVVNQALISSEDMVAFRFQIDPNTPYDTNQAFIDALDSNPASKPALVISGPEIPGDINGDGVVNADDIDAFVAVLLGTPLDPSDEARADLNGDQTADGDDAQPFVAALFASWE